MHVFIKKDQFVNDFLSFFFTKVDASWLRIRNGEIRRERERENYLVAKKSTTQVRF